MKRYLILSLLVAAPLRAQSDVEVIDAASLDATSVDVAIGVDASVQSDASLPDADAPADVSVADAVNTDAAGALDAGACTNRCEANTLFFCDGAQESEIDCAALDARCGLVDESWGFDCLLPEGATCAAGYAQGLSACDGANNATRCCIEGVCSTTSESDCRVFANDDTRPPTQLAGTPNNISTDVNTNPIQSCLGCQQTPFTLTCFPAFLGWFLVRRKK